MTDLATRETVAVTVAVTPEQLSAIGRPDERLLRLLGYTVVNGVLALLIARAVRGFR